MLGRLGATDWTQIVGVIGGTMNLVANSFAKPAAAEAAAGAKAAGASDSEAIAAAREAGRREGQKALRQVSAELTKEAGGLPPVVYVGAGVAGLGVIGTLVYLLTRK